MLEKDTFQAAPGLPVLRNKLVTADAGSVWFTHDTLLAAYCAQDPANCTCKIQNLCCFWVTFDYGVREHRNAQFKWTKGITHGAGSSQCCFCAIVLERDGERRGDAVTVGSRAEVAAEPEGAFVAKWVSIILQKVPLRGQE